MLKLYDKGVYLLNGTEIVEEKEAVAAKTGKDVTPQEAAKNTMAYNILAAHNTSGNMDRPMTLHLSELFRQPEHPDLKNSRFLMYLRTVITHFVRLEEPSTKMTTCLVLPARRNTVESMYRLIRQSSINLLVRC